MEMSTLNLKLSYDCISYNHGITDEVLKLGRFGSRFSMNRMTWIKPSFLWMMYRCG